MAQDKHRLTAWLETAPPWVFTIVASIAGFSAYFAMYGFRKPFNAATYEGYPNFLGTWLDLKSAIIISQILGYACSKYIGVKVCSEATPGRRAALLIGLIVWAEAALFLFGILPSNAKVIAIFLNGLPLGMVWGLVVWFLEGRRISDVLLSAVSCSMIVSSGAVKDVGAWFLHLDVPDHWMPFATGLCFLPLFVASVWLLTCLPQPAARDVAARSKRETMDGARRLEFLRKYLLGLVFLFAVYLLLVACRDFRDNFQAEIFKDLGYGDVPAAFSRSELPIGLAVMASMAALNFFKEHRRALLATFAMMTTGTVLLGIGTLLYDRGLISGFAWMMLLGLGTYLAFIPYNAVLFERLMAITRFAGTAVFGIVFADALGYSGSVGLLLYFKLVNPNTKHLRFLHDYSYFVAILGTLGLIGGGIYFLGRRHAEPSPSETLLSEPQTEPLACIVSPGDQV